MKVAIGYNYLCLLCSFVQQNEVAAFAVADARSTFCASQMWQPS